MLKKLGFYTLGIISSHINRETINNRLSKKFDKVIFLSGKEKDDIKKIMKSSPFPINRILIGTEVSLPYAEKLSFVIAPEYSNNPSLSHLRWDKHEAMERIKKEDFGAIHELVLSRNLHENKHTIDKIKFPCFIKPKNSSSGSFAAEVCDSEKALENYLSKTPKKGKFGLPVNEFLAQDIIYSDEYFVDVASNHAKHSFISDSRQMQSPCKH